MKKIKKNKGILFWITGLSSSGKTTFCKKIYPHIKEKYGPTIIVNGDELRKIFALDGYTKTERLKIGKKYIKFCNLLIKQNINVIIGVVGLFHALHKINRSTFENYLEIFIKTKINILKIEKKKIFYENKTKHVWGIDLKPEFPKKPDIIIVNNFQKSTNRLAKDLIEKIDKKLK